MELEAQTNEVKVEWFGYQGHLCVPCNFHLTTVVSNENKSIMISTVGNYEKPNCIRKEADNTRYEKIGSNRYFETFVGETKLNNGFIEMNVSELIEEQVYVLDKENPTLEEILNSEREADLGHKLMVEKYIRILRNRDDN